MISKITVVFTLFVVVTMFSFIFIVHAQQACKDNDCQDLVDCNVDDNCASNEKCENYKCVNVCNNFTCSDNQNCAAYEHSITCLCWAGYSRDNLNKCERDCMTDRDCPDKSQECKVINKLRRCSQSTGDPCNTDNECSSLDICSHNICVNACSQISCSKQHEECIVRNQKAVCECRKNYGRSNPANKCMLQCIDNYDCLPNQSCISKDGMKICACNYGWAPSNKYEGSCQWVCAHRADCVEGYWCHHQRCVECDGIFCPIVAKN